MKTIKEIALSACEKFQKQYPCGDVPLWQLMVKLEDEIRLFTELKCKETARNVRHKAAEMSQIALSGSGDPHVLHRDIMNIQFDDVKPDI